MDCGGKLETHYKGSDYDDNLTPYYQCLDCKEPYYNNPTVGVAVIHMRDGRILLGKRKSSYRDNLWCIPRGHLDTFEPVMDGAKREFYEETSLNAYGLELFDVSSNLNNIVVIYYLAKSVTGDLEANDDLSEVKYYALDDLPNMAFLSDVMIINKLKSEWHGR